MKQLLAGQEVLYPRLFPSLQAAMRPLMARDRTGLEGHTPKEPQEGGTENDGRGPQEGGTENDGGGPQEGGTENDGGGPQEGGTENDGGGPQEGGTENVGDSK